MPQIPGTDGAIARWVGAWVVSIMASPRRALAGLVVAMVLGFLGAARLEIDADSSKMLSPDLPAQRQALEINAAFPALKETILIMVEARQADTADLAVGALLAQLQAPTDAIGSVFAVSDDAFFQSHGFLYRDLDAVAEIFTRVSKSSNLIATLRENQSPDGFADALIAATELADRAEMSRDALDRLYTEAIAVLEGALSESPRLFGWSSVLDDGSPQGPVTRMISVQPRLDLTRLSPARPALLAIGAAIEAMPDELRAGVTVSVTGEPALRAEEMQSVLGTIGLSMALSLVLVAVILRIGLGSTPRTLMALASLLISLVLTTGFAGAALGALNLVSVAFIVLMVGLGVDFAIHILAHATELRRSGASPHDAMVLTGHRTGLALGLSAITTSLAFLAFAITDFEGMAQLGIIGGVGVLFAFGVAITLIPASAALFPALVGAPVAAAPRSGAAPARPAVPIFVLALGVLAIFPASQARFDADPIALRDPDGPAVAAFRTLAAEPETTPYRVSILAGSAAEAAEISAAFENTPGVGAVISLADLVPKEQDSKLTLLDIAAPPIDHAIAGKATELSLRADDAVRGLDGLRDLLANSQGEAAALNDALERYLQVRSPGRDEDLEHRLFRTFPMMIKRLEALLKADYVDASTLPAPLRDRYLAPDGRERVEIIPETAIQTPEELRRFANQVLAIDPRAAGGPIQMTAAGETVGGAMLLATALAALATGALALLATRRLLDTCAILAPLVVAGLITAAASVLLGLPFNYANVIVLPLLIGIGVDSGIHIALRERRAPGAVFATSTPRAVLFSALTTMAAFGTLALSDHRGTASMGILLVVSMCAAVGCVLALTPVILRSTVSRHPMR